MMQIVEREDDYDEPRFSSGSMSCLFPQLAYIDSSPRKSLFYNKLHQQPLRLTVLKLDGSSFGIEVAKTGTVGELKRAVEAAFRHLPQKGAGRVSWTHVWGQFCLCHEGQKLLFDCDHLRFFGIKDGDQLQFIHHASNTYNLVRIQSGREDSDDEPCISDDYRGEQKSSENDDGHVRENSEDKQGGHAESCDAISRCEYRFTHVLRGWFPYRKLTNSDLRIEERSCSSSSFSYKLLGSFKNYLRFSSNKYKSRKATWKGK